MATTELVIAEITETEMNKLRKDELNQTRLLTFKALSAENVNVNNARETESKDHKEAPKSGFCNRKHTERIRVDDCGYPNAEALHM